MSRRLPSPLSALTLGIALLGVTEAGYAAWRQHRTIDEPMHLQWARRLLETGETERESQFMYNSKTPALLPNVALMRSAEAFKVTDPRAVRFAGRLATVACLLLLFGATFGLARVVSGEAAACLATIATALDPNVIAHGSLSTSDVAYALATLLALWSALLFAERPALGRGVILGLALGLAFAVKFTAVFLLLGLLATPLLLGRRADEASRGPAAVGALLVTAACACVTICAAYLFHGVAVPFARIHWQSALLSRIAELLPWLRLPLPADFLTGLDLSWVHERIEYHVVILSRHYVNGVWFYFALLWLLKTPLLVLLATILGLVRAVRCGLFLQLPAARILAFHLVLYLAYFSFAFHAQVGYRYVLMCVPLVYILAAAGLAPLRENRAARLAGVAVVLVALLENAFYLGNPLSFTNAAAWPKRQVFRLITDSNLDWGQNRDKIGAWLAEKEFAGAVLNPPEIVPGRNVLDVNLVSGARGFERYRWLREHADPVGHLGHTYVYFDVDPALYARFLRERRSALP